MARCEPVRRGFVEPGNIYLDVALETGLNRGLCSFQQRPTTASVAYVIRQRCYILHIDARNGAALRLPRVLGPLTSMHVNLAGARLSPLYVSP